MWTPRALSLDGGRLIADGLLVTQRLHSLHGRRSQTEWCHCGYEGCADGNWVCPRTAGPLVALLPDFEALTERDDGYWAPPAWMRSRGIVLLERAGLEGLVGVAALDAVPPLTGAEAARALQWSAPFEILGRFPDPVALQRENVLATSAESLPDECARLSALLVALTTSPTPEVRPSASDDATVDFYLDDANHTTWSPMVVRAGQNTLSFGPSAIITPA